MAITNLSDGAVIGLTFAQAAAKLAARGLTIRMTFKDGQALVCTRDYVPTRVNVSTIDGIVEEVTGRG